MKREMKQLPGGFKLLPPLPDCCQTCAGDHAPTWPHNRDSLYYQYAFYADNGRWPTWADALEHCPPEIRTPWERELTKLGIKIQ